MLLNKILKEFAVKENKKSKLNSDLNLETNSVRSDSMQIDDEREYDSGRDKLKNNESNKPTSKINLYDLKR